MSAAYDTALDFSEASPAGFCSLLRFLLHICHHSAYYFTVNFFINIEIKSLIEKMMDRTVGIFSECVYSRIVFTSGITYICVLPGPDRNGGSPRPVPISRRFSGLSEPSGKSFLSLP